MMITVLLPMPPFDGSMRSLSDRGERMGYAVNIPAVSAAPPAVHSSICEDVDPAEPPADQPRSLAGRAAGDALRLGHDDQCATKRYNVQARSSA